MGNLKQAKEQATVCHYNTGTAWICNSNLFTLLRDCLTILSVVEFDFWDYSSSV
jgi:hypothetical protein